MSAMCCPARWASPAAKRIVGAGFGARKSGNSKARAGRRRTPGTGPAAFGKRPQVKQQEVMMRKLMGRLIRDERGGEVIEYALIAGLIIVAAIAVIGTVGTKVLARWTSVDSSL